jgi:TrmH family RNA methyltransferase
MVSFPQLSQGLLKKYTRLTRKKFRVQENAFLAEGMMAVKEMMISPFSPLAVVVTDRFTEENPKIINDIVKKHGNIIRLTSKRGMEQLSGTVTPQGIVAVIEKYVWSKRYNFLEADKLIYLDRISEPGNLAAVIRNAAWFGFDGILVSPGSVDPYSPKVIRGSVGAFFHLPIYENVDFNVGRDLLEEFSWIAAEPTADLPLHRVEKNGKTVLCFGNEAEGLSQTIRDSVDQLVKISSPAPRIESLNLAVSAGIFMYEFTLPGDRKA